MRPSKTIQAAFAAASFSSWLFMDQKRNLWWYNLLLTNDSPSGETDYCSTNGLIFFQRLQTSLTPAVQRVSVRQWRAGQPLAYRLQRGHHAPLLQVPHRLLPPLRTLRRRVLDLIHYSTSGMHKLNCNILTIVCIELSVKDKGPIKYW